MLLTQQRVMLVSSCWRGALELQEGPELEDCALGCGLRFTADPVMLFRWRLMFRYPPFSTHALNAHGSAWCNFHQAYRITICLMILVAFDAPQSTFTKHLRKEKNKLFALLFILFNYTAFCRYNIIFQQ